MLRELVGRDGEVRMTENREILETHGSRGELGGRAGRLAEVHDGRVRDCRLDGGCGGLAPERVEHVARAFAVERVLEGRHEVVGLVEAERGVGSELGSALEPRGTASGRDDPRRSQQLRRLNRNQPDRARCTEDEHSLAAGERRTPGERQPTGEAGDPESGRERGIRALGHLDHMRVGDSRTLGHRALRRPPERAAEDPDQPAVVGTTDGLAAGDIGQLRVAGRENTA